MAREPITIMRRRFTGRLAESGLLVLAVALGVAMAASGLTLLYKTSRFEKEILSTPLYRELVVTTQGNAEDMALPVIEVRDDTVLTFADLSAAELVPQIAEAYIAKRTDMGFITDDLLNKKGMGPGRRRAEDKDGEDEMTNRFFDAVDTYLEGSKDDSVIVPVIDNLRGFEVTPAFFRARELEAIEGSLFTDSDMRSGKKLAVLGANAPSLLTGEDISSQDVQGKKLVSYFDYYTVIGVLKPTGTGMDDMFFTPDPLSGSERGRGMRQRFMNTQLRFLVEHPTDLDSAAGQLSLWFDRQYGQGQVVISNPRAEALKLVNRNRGISFLILFLSLSGLFIATVNVSHILLSRALRMRKSVGILKALGASKNNILKLFAGEAFVIVLSGSVLGTALAYPLSRSMEKALALGGDTWIPLMGGVLLSSLVVFVFSIVPSRTHYAIDPAEAMRSQS